MTIEEILDCSAAQLKAMSDAQLLEHFKSFLTVTRPELATRPKQTTIEKVTIDPKKQKMLAILAADGMDLSFLKKKQYKK